VAAGPHVATHYAPPEALYGSLRHTRASLRSADLYLLGSLLLSVLGCRVPLTTLWVCLLDDELQPGNHEGPYSQVLPFVRDAYNNAINFAAQKIPSACDGERVIRVVRMLTDPDPDRRGHPRCRDGTGDSLSLRRVVTEIDLIRRRAELYRRSA
jgi:hypothetical protein